MAESSQVGQRLSFDGAVCTVRFVGEVKGTTGQWLGVEWDDATRGKHNGSHKGTQYFQCLSSSPTAASFVRPTRPSDPPRSFLAALHAKYAPEATSTQQQGAGAGTGQQIAISGKVVEEVGFDKIRKQLAQVHALKIVILDGMRVVSVRDGETDSKGVGETCPSIVELDLSRNLFTRMGVVVGVVRELKELRSLRLNGNRFQNILQDEFLQGAEEIFKGVKDLALEETLLTWDDIHHVATKFTSLVSLNSGANQLTKIPDLPLATLSSTLTTLNLEFNEFKAFSDLEILTTLQSLRNLHLKGNNISDITSSPSMPIPVFSSTVHYLDVSYNAISAWAFVDTLPIMFPGLVALRLAHNPIYDNPHGRHGVPAAPDTGSKGANPTEESHMVTVARLPLIKTLNFVTVTTQDRSQAEMFYLSRIARQLASIPEGEAASVLSAHPRWEALCEVYGEPDVIRSKEEVNSEFLEARLITVHFHFVPPSSPSAPDDDDSDQDQEGLQQNQKPTTTVRRTKKQIPKSTDIYALKGIAGRLFAQQPLSLKLVWETGEWDPVAGFDDEKEDDGGGGDDSEEDEAIEEELQKALAAGKSIVEEHRAHKLKGRFVKREVELRDGPRQLGFCVDGLEVRIRVEVRRGMEARPAWG